MNSIASFRLCKLSNEELRSRIDRLTDEMYQTGKLPTRHIPARPDEDYDLLVGELLQRSKEMQAEDIRLKNLIEKMWHEHVLDPIMWTGHDSEREIPGMWLQFCKDNNIE